MDWLDRDPRRRRRARRHRRLPVVRRRAPRPAAPPHRDRRRRPRRASCCAGARPRRTSRPRASSTLPRRCSCRPPRRRRSLRTPRTTVARFAAESELTRTLGAVLETREEVDEIREAAGPDVAVADQLIDELAVACRRVGLARRFHNDVVRSCLQLRRQRIVAVVPPRRIHAAAGDRRLRRHATGGPVRTLIRLRLTLVGGPVEGTAPPGAKDHPCARPAEPPVSSLPLRRPWPCSWPAARPGATPPRPAPTSPSATGEATERHAVAHRDPAPAQTVGPDASPLSRPSRRRRQAGARREDRQHRPTPSRTPAW